MRSRTCYPAAHTHTSTLTNYTYCTYLEGEGGRNLLVKDQSSYQEGCRKLQYQFGQAVCSHLLRSAVHTGEKMERQRQADRKLALLSMHRCFE